MILHTFWPVLFVALCDCCIPTQSIGTTTTAAPTCPVCGAIYGVQCANGIPAGCVSSTNAGATYSLSADGTTCTIDISCPYDTTAVFYLPDGTGPIADHEVIQATCYENSGIWHYGLPIDPPDFQISDFVCKQ